MNDLRSGIAGTGEVLPGAHLCAVYSGPDERDRLLASFLQEGVRHGDHCVVLGAGEFSVDQMVSLRVPPTASTEGEVSLLRAAGEMSSAPHGTGAMKMSVYESAVIQVLARLPALFLCLYDLERFDRGMLVEVLKIHSTVLLDGAVLHNTRCAAPTTYAQSTPVPAPQQFPLARRRSGGADEDQWLSLTLAEVRVAELVACGMTNRATAEELVVSPHTVDAHLKHMYVKLGIHSRVELTVLALQHRLSPT